MWDGHGVGALPALPVLPRRRALEGERLLSGAVSIGLALAPEPAWLALCEPLLDEVDYVSVTPETTWRGPSLERNGFGRLYAELRAERGLSFVAHTVGYSLGSRSPGDDARRERWRAAMRRDVETFAFHWWTDHGALTTVAGENLALPLPVPFTRAYADGVRARLDEMAELVPRVGLENSAHLFLPGPPLDEPRWLTDAVGPHHLLLDLHNLWANAQNLHFEALAWLERAPLERVIEIHVAGGRATPEGWPHRRLDGHDAAIPEEVFDLLTLVAPRCPGLRGVALERNEGSVGPREVGPLRAELRRLRSCVAAPAP